LALPHTPFFASRFFLRNISAGCGGIKSSTLRESLRASGAHSMPFLGLSTGALLILNDNFLSTG
jgi:hypothetical protein